MGARKRIDHECQAHVYMTREIYDLVLARSLSEFRSLNGQFLYYVHKGIEAERAEIARGADK